MESRTVRTAGWFLAPDQPPIFGLRMARPRTAALVVLAAACGAGSTTSGGKNSGAAASACSQLAALYRDALPEAAACNPGVSACTAQRPLVVSLAGTPEPEGLCWVAYEGFLDPSMTAGLDALIARYTSAGCTIGACPGPGPHPTTCVQNARGTWSCGGI